MVTIVVLIILAVISINAVVGENGLMRQAEKAREHQANAEASDNGALDELAGYLANITGEGNAEVPEPTNPDYFSYDCDDETKTATITGIKEEYRKTGYYQEAYYQEDGYYTICIQDGEKEITDLVLPSSVVVNGETYTVTAIGDGAFSNEYYYTESGDENIVEPKWTSVIIPNSVISIGESAFYYCSSLTSVTIGNSVINIGRETFGNCEKLTNIIIPDSVISIEDYLFNGCSSLTSITIGNSVTKIGRYAFYNCSSLTNITLPDSVTRIEASAFGDCINLESITNGSGITYIGEEAFSGAPVTSLLPDGYIYIGKVYYAYKGEMPEGTSIEIREGTTSIYCYAFGYEENLVSITIPNSITKIEEFTFSDCSNLITVTIDSLEIASSIDDYDCGELGANATTIYIKNTIPESSINSYITNTENFTKATESDKEGYVKYTKN